MKTAVWRTSLLAGVGLVAVVTAPLAGSDAIVIKDAPPLRVAFSETMLRGVNLGDAKAALSLWTTEMARGTGMKLADQQDWVMPSEQLLAAIRAGLVDVFCITVQEYSRVAAFVDTTQILAGDGGGDEMVLVVRGNDVTKLSDLRGRILIVLDSPATIMAETWLSVSLWREGLDSPERLFGRLTRSAKLSGVVLPLFFGQADACIVTRRGLNTMLELNPQLSWKLRVLLASPKLENSFFAWRQNYPSQLKKPIFDRLLELRSRAAAGQLLMLFQSPGFTAETGACLRPALSILEMYERHQALRARSNK